MENVLLEDWVIEQCRTGVEIGGGITCSNFTLRNAVFSAVSDQDSTCIGLSGKEGTLTVQRMRFENVIFDGFLRGLKIEKDVLIKDTLRIVDSDFKGARHEFDDFGGKTNIEVQRAS
jgi:hypothetical protein